MKRMVLSLTCLVVLARMASPAALIDTFEGFEPRVFREASGDSMPFRIHKPHQTTQGTRYPLVLYMHGALGRGTDNIVNINSFNVPGSHLFADSASQSKWPCYIICPQCPTDSQWCNAPWAEGSYTLSKWSESTAMKRLLRLIAEVEREFTIDTNRRYVLGQSMGGGGAWDIAVRHPTIFAAVVSVVGYADPTQARTIAHLPAWGITGDKDNSVPWTSTVAMIDSLKAVGNINARITLHKGYDHGQVATTGWEQSGLREWIMSWTKSGTTVIPVKVALKHDRSKASHLVGAPTRSGVGFDLHGRISRAGSGGNSPRVWVWSPINGRGLRLRVHMGSETR